MNLADFNTLRPEILLCGVGSLVLLLEAFLPKVRALFSPLALLGTLGAICLVYQQPPALSFGGQLAADAITQAFSYVVLVSTLLALLASESYLRRERIHAGEYHALLLWCATGLLLMLRAQELLTLFLALELLSLCLYCLAAYNRRSQLGTEAAIKYFLMGAFVSAFILMGIALLYGETRSTELSAIGQALAAGSISVPVTTLGILLLIAGFGFKMSVVPFHAWSPDTYQGAPSPFVGFLSVAPKVASAVVVVRILMAASGGALGEKWSSMIALLSVLSMVVGNVLALVQRDIKRMLAYSGIAHMGYLLLAMVTIGEDSWAPIWVYLLSYALMNATAFAVVTVLYPRSGEQHLISDLAGAGFKRRALAACLAVAMLSLGGIPPTFGFIGKYFVFLNAIRHGHLGLAIVGVLASLVGVFYYLRVIYTLYMKTGDDTKPQPSQHHSWSELAALVAAAATLVLGIWPWRFLGWIIESLGGRY